MSGYTSSEHRVMVTQIDRQIERIRGLLEVWEHIRCTQCYGYIDS